MESPYQIQLAALQQIITESVPAERIYVTGRLKRKFIVESIFNQFVNPSIEIDSIDVVVVVASAEKRPENELQDIIENRCKRTVSVNVIVLPAPKFIQLLGAGHPFVFSLVKSGLLLYDAGNLHPIIEKIPDAKAMLEEAGSGRDTLLHSADISIEGAQYYQSQQHYQMAAFLLHQATEHALMALLLVMTGYRFHTHNLDKLFRYSGAFSLDVCGLFPRNTPEETALFQLLQKAYVDARYKQDYVITESQTLVLVYRVQQLVEMVRLVSSRQLLALQNYLYQ